MKKIFLIGFLILGIFLTSGCENFNYESKFESSTSVSVSTGSYKESSSTSNGPLAFKANDVNLKKGCTEFNFSITNNSDKDTTLTGMDISFKATDDNQKVIREGSATFDNLSIKLPAGKEVYENFVIDDDKVEAYNESFNIEYKITNIILNPPVQ